MVLNQFYYNISSFSILFFSGLALLLSIVFIFLFNLVHKSFFLIGIILRWWCRFYVWNRIWICTFNLELVSLHWLLWGRNFLKTHKVKLFHLILLRQIWINILWLIINGILLIIIVTNFHYHLADCLFVSIYLGIYVVIIFLINTDITIRG